MKEIHREMNVESVEKLMDETAEARAYQQVRSIICCLSSLRLRTCTGNIRHAGEYTVIRRRRRRSGRACATHRGTNQRARTECHSSGCSCPCPSFCPGNVRAATGHRGTKPRTRPRPCLMATFLAWTLVALPCIISTRDVTIGTYNTNIHTRATIRSCRSSRSRASSSSSPQQERLPLVALG